MCRTRKCWPNGTVLKRSILSAQCSKEAFPKLHLSRLRMSGEVWLIGNNKTLFVLSLRERRVVRSVADDHVIGFQALPVSPEPGNRCASTACTVQHQPTQLMTYRSLFVAACGLHAWISFGLSREITILGWVLLCFGWGPTCGCCSLVMTANILLPQMIFRNKILTIM